MTKAIIGTGDYTYELISPFGESPPDFDLDQVSHIATDSNNQVYIFRRKDPPIVVLSPEGRLLKTMCEGQFLDAHGLFISSQDEIYVVDRDAHEMIKLDANGKVLLRLGKRGEPSLGNPFNHPADVAVAPNGDILVADGYGNSRVHRFSASGEHITSWGNPGTGPGSFTTPHGVWVDDKNKVYVCDRENNRVQVFSLTGDYLSEWGDLFHPMDIIGDAKGNFVVSDQIPRISFFDSNGNLISRGRTPFFGHGMWMDSEGNIYIADTSEGVAKLSKR